MYTSYISICLDLLAFTTYHNILLLRFSIDCTIWFSLVSVAFVLSSSSTNDWHIKQIQCSKWITIANPQQKFKIDRSEQRSFAFQVTKLCLYTSTLAQLVIEMDTIQWFFQKILENFLPLRAFKIESFLLKRQHFKVTE